MSLRLLPSAHTAITRIRPIPVHRMATTAHSGSMTACSLALALGFTMAGAIATDGIMTAGSTIVGTGVTTTAGGATTTAGGAMTAAVGAAVVATLATAFTAEAGDTTGPLAGFTVVAVFTAETRDMAVSAVVVDITEIV